MPLGEGQDAVIALTESEAQSGLWSGSVGSAELHPSGLYAIEVTACDVAGNHYASPEAIDAFLVDSVAPVLQAMPSLVVTPADDGNPPDAGYAGIGDAVMVTIAYEGEVAEAGSWSPALSEVSLDGQASPTRLSWALSQACTLHAHD